MLCVVAVMAVVNAETVSVPRLIVHVLTAYHREEAAARTRQLCQPLLPLCQP